MRHHKLGMVRVAAVTFEVVIGNPTANREHMMALLQSTNFAQGADLIVFQEMCLTAYSCEDLFLDITLLQAARRALHDFLLGLHEAYVSPVQVLVVGLPLRVRDILFNVAVVCTTGGEILAVIPKSLLPNTSEFYEARQFSSGLQVPPDIKTVELCGQTVPFGTDILVDLPTNPPCRMGVEICEDLWGVINPSQFQALGGALIHVNPSASTRVIAKADYRLMLVQVQSGRCMSAYVYASCGAGESTKDVVWSGHLIIAERGSILEEKESPDHDAVIVQDVDTDTLRHERANSHAFRQQVAQYHPEFRVVTPRPRVPFSVVNDLASRVPRLLRRVDQLPFVPSDPATLDARAREISEMQRSGLRRRLLHVGKGKPMPIFEGISGGVDSTDALLTACLTYDDLGWDRKLIHGVTMPGPGTTSRTKGNSWALMEGLGITALEIPIEPIVTAKLRAVGHEPCWHCLQCENAQARERTDILMTLGFVLGTGDLIELILGWCTFNGDHMSMYNVNAGVPKTLMRFLIDFSSRQPMFKNVAGYLQDILATPVSPELIKPSGDVIEQKSEDILGPYELHEFFAWYMLRFGMPPEKIATLAAVAFEGKYTKEEILKHLKTLYRLFLNCSQYKRDTVPGGMKIGTVSVSPRGDLRIPTEVCGQEWSARCRMIEAFFA